MPVRLELGVGPEVERHGAALDPGPIHPLGAVLPVHVHVVVQFLTGLRVVNGRVHQLDVQHGRVEIVGRVVGAVEVDLALLEAPISPHVLVLHERPVRVTDIERHWLAEHFPMRGDPGPQAQEHHLGAHLSLVGFDSSDLAALDVVTLHFHP